MTQSDTPQANDQTLVKRESNKDITGPAVAAQTKAKSGLGGLAISAIFLSFLLSVAALVGAGFTWYQTQVVAAKKESDLSVGVMEINSYVSRLGDGIARLESAQGDVVTKSDLEAKLLASANQTDIRLREFESSQKSVLATVERLNEDLSKGAQDFAIAEVQQLLKLANHSLNFSKDVGAAKNALSIADGQLKALADPRFSTVRQVLNEEISELEAITQLDKAAVSGQLRAISTLVPSLALENETPSLGAAVISSEDANGSLLAELRNMGRDILKLLKPERIDHAPKPLLAPEQRYFLDQNIRLQLSKAELALLQSQPEIFTAAVEAAQSMLKEYYATRDDDVNNVLQQLASLEQTEFAEQLPNISRSYGLLKSIQEQ